MAQSECEMNKAIGGYFEREPRTVEEHVIPQKDGILLNTARNAFEYILQCLDIHSGIALPLLSPDLRESSFAAFFASAVLYFSAIILK